MLGYYLPSVVDVAGLISGVISTFLGFIIPIAIKLKYKSNLKSKLLSIEDLGDIFILASFIILGLGNIVNSLNGLINLN